MFTATDKTPVHTALVGSQKLQIFPRLIEEISDRQSRGFVYQIAGSFETAIADHEFSLQVALATRDQWVIWQSLMHSAIALDARAQPDAEEYFRAALELARVINDPPTLAHSLNRMGSFITGMDRPLEGIALHKEAFALLEQMNEPQEMARTFNALGNSYASLGDLEQAVLYYDNAATQFRSLADPIGLSSALTGLALCGAHYLNSVSKGIGQDLVQCVENGEEALAITKKICWRSGEALASISLGLALSLSGNYGRALKDVRRGLQIAREIKHLHWQILAHIALGATYSDLLSYRKAQEHLEEALTLSAQTQTNRWHLIILGFLVPTYILQEQIPRAEAALSSFSRDTPLRTIGQRQAWLALAELRFAQAKFSRALKIIDTLIHSAGRKTGTDDSLSRLVKLRCEILIQLGLDDEARECLILGLESTVAQGAQSLAWRFHALLGEFYWRQKRYSKSERHYVAARRLVEKLANTIPDVQLRTIFLHQAGVFIPQRRTSRAGKLLYGGLTKRQYETAILIAQKKTNREIAQELRMSEPGVEKQFKNILTKLGFNSRVQIRSWMINLPEFEEAA
jgi:tetratricopeptide (TPR) repeat protein